MWTPAWFQAARSFLRTGFTGTPRRHAGILLVRRRLRVVVLLPGLPHILLDLSCCDLVVDLREEVGVPIPVLVILPVGTASGIASSPPPGDVPAVIVKALDETKKSGKPEKSSALKLVEPVETAEMH